MAESDPNPRDVGVIFNPTRHEHELCLSANLKKYTCSGCKEFGAEIGYKCSSSSCQDFTLHKDCATLPDVYEHSDESFKFRSKTHMWHHCDACRDVLNGFVYETERRHLRPELRLHPLCMVLPKTLDFSGHDHKLKFVTSNVNGKEYTCSSCDSPIDSGCWRYQCEEVECKVYLDLSCAKIDFFGLKNSDIQRIAPVGTLLQLKSKIPSGGTVTTSVSTATSVVGLATSVVALCLL